MGSAPGRVRPVVAGYDHVSAVRYSKVESRPDSFSLRLAPRLIRLLEREGAAGASGAKMLDIGAGTGQLTDALRAAGCQTAGVDRSVSMLENRVCSRSSTRGAVAAADAASLPLVGSFDLVTATFNVINHLPDIAAVTAMFGEVARLLAPGGLFVFDIDTELGLQATSELTEHHVGPTDVTTRRRRWVDDGTLQLDASGMFFDGRRWLRYQESIKKIVVSTKGLESCCRASFLEAPSWRSDDLVTVLDEPEMHAVAYGVTRGNPAP